MHDWIERITAGDLRALARAATAVENRTAAAEQLLRELFPRTGRATVLGITGSPGAGKSTLVAGLIRQIRSEGLTIGVVAVDPSSPFSGGAILGDRIRMQDSHSDPGVFIRSMATRGRLGGLAGATSDMVLLFDAAGRDVVLVETVGVGQDEVDIVRLADATLVVLVPGAGDDVQALKAGIMEIADVFVVNKADLPGADRLVRDLKSSLQLAHRPDGWVPPIVEAVASEGRGVAESLDAARGYLATGARKTRSLETWRLRLREMLRESLLARIPEAALEEAAAAISERRRDPYTAVESLLGLVCPETAG
ncbi:MAG: methylmalonyl Co-A mutase-associated GTPase MeaB [Acidobacteria bacterium]|nr:methylmalonyl Co-A mutase-associated GTPase MeaB [Acidobacteriota bacterium]